MSAVIGLFGGGQSKIFARRASGRLLRTWVLTAYVGAYSRNWKMMGWHLLCSGCLLEILRYFFAPTKIVPQTSFCMIHVHTVGSRLSEQLCATTISKRFGYVN